MLTSGPLAESFIFIRGMSIIIMLCFLVCLYCSKDARGIYSPAVPPLHGEVQLSKSEMPQGK